MKTCSKCKSKKDLSLFPKDKSKKLGVSNTCKDCKKEYLKNYRKEKPEIYDNYLAKNYEKRLKTSRDWKLKNEAKNKATKKEYLSKQVNGITERYAKHLLYESCILEHTDILIKIKQVQILGKRKIKELEK